MASAALHMGIGALLVWLMAGHWLFSGWDRPGMEPREIVTVVVGAGLGLVSALLGGRHRKMDSAETQAQPQPGAPRNWRDLDKRYRPRPPRRY